MKNLKKILATVLALSLLAGFSASVASFAADNIQLEPYIVEQENSSSFTVNNILVGDVNSLSNETNIVTYRLQNGNTGNIDSIDCNVNVPALYIPETLNGIPVKITCETIFNLGQINPDNLVVFLPLSSYNSENEEQAAIDSLIIAGISEDNTVFFGRD